MRVGVALFLIVSLAGVTSASAQEPLHTTVGSVDDEEGADILGAFRDSLKLLLIEHGSRIAFQSKTRRELGGNFWSDYRRSVRFPSQWGDTDTWSVNYIGHPIPGAAAGYIWLDHEPRAPATFVTGGGYWGSRLRATAWSAVYSVQFEIGPLSEASIGNVGMRPDDRLGRPRRHACRGIRADRRRRCSGSFFGEVVRGTCSQSAVATDAAPGPQPWTGTLERQQRTTAVAS